MSAIESTAWDWIADWLWFLWPNKDYSADAEEIAQFADHYGEVWLG